MAPETSGRVVLSALFCLFVSASIYLLRSFNKSELNVFLYLSFILGINCWFWFGNISYYCGLSLLFIFIGYLARRVDKLEKIDSRCLFGLLLVLFFTHLIPYLEAGLFLAVLILLSNERKTALKLGIPGLLSGLLVIWYLWQVVSEDHLGARWIWWPNINSFAGSAIFPLLPFWSFASVQKAPLPIAALTGSLNFGWLCAIAVLGLFCGRLAIKRWHERRTRLIVSAAAGYAVLAVVSGYRVAMGNIGERFIYPALWLMVCWLGSVPEASLRGLRWPMFRRAAAALVVVQCIWLNCYVVGESRELSGEFEQLRSAKEKSNREFCALYEEQCLRERQIHRGNLLRLTLPIVWPTGRLPYYLFIHENLAGPIFPTGMLSFAAKGNYDDVCEAEGVEFHSLESSQESK